MHFGIIIEGYFTISDNLLRAFDMGGKFLGTQTVKAGDHLEHVARRLLTRAQWPYRLLAPVALKKDPLANKALAIA